MIYGRLLEKVSIKKIPLRVWSLSSEISTTLEHYKELLLESTSDPEATVAMPYSAQKIQDFYENNFQRASAPVAERPKLSLIKNETPDAQAPAEQTPAVPLAMAEVPVTTDVKVEVADGADPALLPIDLRRMLNRYIGESEVYQAYAILYDINFDEISFFSEFTFIPGQEIVIELGIAKSFTLHAEVSLIKSFQGKSRLIQAWKPICRVRAKFLCRHPGDRTLLREFLRSVDTKLRAEG
jgi:hypothetical protein